MCGISGIVSIGPMLDYHALVLAMNENMVHRGPDATGIFTDINIGLGHCRLSIIDLSDSANQPFHDANNRFVIVFNGEIYNFHELKRELSSYPYRTNSDTEVILAAYIKWGINFLDKLKGMFAFAIWDRQEEEILIVRDRFGVKPVYYYYDGTNLVFASEIRAILATGLVKRELDHIALRDYLSYQSVITPRTLINGINQLPAGSYLLYKNGEIALKKYWDIAWKRREISERSIDEVKPVIKDLLFKAVERRLISDVPLGVFLSGGIDSSAILAIMAQLTSSKVNAFTIGFKEREYDETPFANMVAQKYNAVHNKVLLQAGDFLDELPAALNSMDTPSGDGLNTFVVSKAIRKSGISVALSGIGGDELFSGYPIFGQFKRISSRRALFERTYWLRRLLSELVPAGGQRNERMRQFLRLHDCSIVDIYPLLRQISSPSKIEKLTHVKANGQDSLGDLLIGERKAIQSFEYLSQVTIAEYIGYTQHVLLKDTDQMSMAHSLEVREPFFDHELVEYVVNIPDHIKNPIYSKSLMVESLKPLIPNEIVFRKKQGFVLPYDQWLRKDLVSFANKKIRQLSTRPIFREEEIISYWEDFLENKKAIRWADIWILVVLEHWLECNGVE